VGARPGAGNLTMGLRFAFNEEGRVPSRSRGEVEAPRGAEVSEQSQRQRYVGVNSSGVSYWQSEMPFLNLFKGASCNEGEGSGHPFNGQADWCTFNETAWDTSESAYVQVDADGYPTSLIAKPTPPGGQKFTGVQASALTPLTTLLPTQPVDSHTALNPPPPSCPPLCQLDELQRAVPRPQRGLLLPRR
jgi:hypothetical protein